VRKPSQSKLEKEEQWILSRLNTLVERTTQNLENYYIDVAVKEIKDFILEDISRFYLKFAKQRAESAGKSELKRISNLTAYVLHNTLIMSSIIIPFASEYIYRELYSENGQSIFMNSWPKPDKRRMDDLLEGDFDILKEVSNAVLYLREKTNSKLRWPLKEVKIETNNDQIIESLERTSNLLAMYANAKSIKIVPGKASAKEVRPIFQKLGPEFKENAQAVADELRKADANDVQKSIDNMGYYRLHTSKGAFDIKPEQFTISEKSRSDGHTIRYRDSEIYFEIDSELTNELKEELMGREIIRRIQIMRKEMGLTRLDKINIHISSDEATKTLIEGSREQIRKIAKIKGMEVNKSAPKDSYSKEFDILGAKIGISIVKA
jgi:isoleucyl-tRNA synthetase